MDKLEFVKAVASGNDFIILNTINGPKFGAREQISRLAKELCRRRLSVGADGLLLIEPSAQADFKMRVFNPDGQEVTMCGNGARCVALFASQKKIVKNDRMFIETGAGNLQAEVKKDKVKLKMSPPKDLRLDFPLPLDSGIQKANYINTGVPHVVCFVPGLENFPVGPAGKNIRYHPEFQPEGTNANFVQFIGKQRIKIRTYERGVEEETLACGTGAVAASIVTMFQELKPQGRHTVKVETRSGETLVVYFTVAGQEIKDVFLEGSAKIVYKALLN
ncbi:MAG: diaminopimelate epimerase [Candidatus Omnitrophota bacterium]